jgi:hypothetical protein
MFLCVFYPLSSMFFLSSSQALMSFVPQSRSPAVSPVILQALDSSLIFTYINDNPSMVQGSAFQVEKGLKSE